MLGLEREFSACFITFELHFLQLFEKPWIPLLEHIHLSVENGFTFVELLPILVKWLANSRSGLTILFLLMFLWNEIPCHLLASKLAYLLLEVLHDFLQFLFFLFDDIPLDLAVNVPFGVHCSQFLVDSFILDLQLFVGALIASQKGDFRGWRFQL